MESYEGKSTALSPEELAAFSRLDPQLPHNGLKAAELVGSTEQAIRLSHLQAQQREFLNEERVARFGSLSVGDWNQDLQLIEVRSGKGKFWHTMGYNTGNKKYIYPEEGLYLMELNMLEVLYQGVPLSLQEAYELLIPSELSLEEYQTYAHLTRLGYIITRHKQHNVTEYEQRIKLFQHHTNRRRKSCKKVQVWFDKMQDKVNNLSTAVGHASGDVTDESYYSSSSVFSLNSAGDFDTKVKHSQQPPVANPEDVEEKTDEMEDLSEEASSKYSDGPISGLSPQQQERGDSEFDSSLVNLLDYHKRDCSSGSKQKEGRVLKRKRSSWYMTNLNSVRSLSGGSEDWRPREAPAGLSAPFTDQIEDSPRLCADTEKKARKEVDSTVEGNVQSTDRRDISSVDIDKFLQVVMKKSNNENEPKAKKGKRQQSRPYSLWNFTKIHIPDAGTGSPGPNLLPAHLLTKVFRESAKDMNQKCVPGLPKVCLVSQRSEECIERAESSGFDQGLEYCKQRKSESADRSTNWMEYKSQISQKTEKDLKELLASPVSHLWEGSVQPLVRPSDAINTESLQRKLQVIQSADMKDLPRSSYPTSKDAKITFDVHLPDCTFRKTCPGKPAFRVVIFSIEDPVPEIDVQMSILHQSGMVPVLFAIVDNADVTFCSFTDAKRMTTIL